MNMDLENKNSFLNFIKDRNFKILNYNDIEIVNKSQVTLKSKKEYEIDGIKIAINSNSIYKKTYSALKAITTPYENTIVYNNTKYGTERYAEEFIKLMDHEQFHFICDDEVYNIFIEHLENQFGNEWIITKALKHGIGVHHGLVPKYIQKEIINLFNSGKLLVLISTTTITEGVNTTAKNIIITSNKKGSKQLRNFDAKNIAGRAGRFLKHYSGRIIIINNDFEKTMEINDIPKLKSITGMNLGYHTTPDYQGYQTEALAGTLTEEDLRRRVREVFEKTAEGYCYCPMFLPFGGWSTEVMIDEIMKCGKTIYKDA